MSPTVVRVTAFVPLVIFRPTNGDVLVVCNRQYLSSFTTKRKADRNACMPL